MHLPAKKGIGVRVFSLVTVIASFNGLLCAVQAKSSPAHVESQIMVLPEQVVQEQWPATLELVNAPTDMEQIEPGQCVRFAVVATGDGRDALLKRMQIGFEFTFSGKTQTFAAEPAQAIKQIKPHGGDFVTQALGSAGIKNPVLSMASLAASKAGWCAPLDAQDGSATLQGRATIPDGKNVTFESRTIRVKTFETARKQAPFKNGQEVGSWIMQYYAAPDPAQLWPALRMVAADEKTRGSSSTMIFFVSALRADKLAAEDLMKKLPGEDQWVRRYSATALKWAGYSTESLTSAFSPEDQSFLNSLQQPDPFDMTPGADIGARQDMLWSIFFATGSIKPVRVIASELAWSEDYKKFRKTAESGRKPDLDAGTFRAVGYGAAGWSLGALSNQAPLVADYIDAIRAAPDTPPVVKNELGHLFDNPAFRSPASQKSR